MKEIIALFVIIAALVSPGVLVVLTGSWKLFVAFIVLALLCGFIISIGESMKSHNDGRWERYKMAHGVHPTYDEHDRLRK